MRQRANRDQCIAASRFSIRRPCVWARPSGGGAPKDVENPAKLYAEIRALISCWALRMSRWSGRIAVARLLKGTSPKYCASSARGTRAFGDMQHPLSLSSTAVFPGQRQPPGQLHCSQMLSQLPDGDEIWLVLPIHHWRGSNCITAC